MFNGFGSERTHFIKMTLNFNAHLKQCPKS